MKKFLILCLLIFNFGISFSYAASGDIKVIVTEKIPGADCKPADAGSGYTGTYECTIEKGFGSIMDMANAIIKYMAFIASLCGVLFIVYSGIMYSMSGIDQSLKENSKKRIVQTLKGLLVLMLSGVILNLIAPWIFTK